MSRLMAPLKRSCIGLGEYGLNIAASEYQESGLRFLRTSDIDTMGAVSEEGVYIEESPDLEERHRLVDGDLLFSRAGTLGRCLRYTDELGPATYAGYLVRFRPSSSAEPRFIEYCSQAAFFQGAIVADAVTSTISNFNAEKYANIQIPDPPLAEQRAIADYLDAETARIDALIAKKQQLIHLLEERRWRFFEKRVQESCGPVVPLRRAVDFLTDGPFGSAFSSAEYVEGGLGVVRLGNIGFVEFKDDDIAFLPLERWDEFRRYTVREGDLLVAGLGDPKNHAGRVCVAPDYGPLIVKGKCFCARVNKEMATPEFLAMSCSSPASAERFGLSAQGSTRQMINLSIFREHEITLPSVHAQREIVKATENEWRRSDHIAANLESQINLLSERRQALITAAVTGEFAVPGLMEKHR